MTKIILLSADETAEMKDAEWLREATPAEAQKFKDEHPNLVLSNLSRPYFFQAVDLEKCPAEFRSHVVQYDVIFRFRKL